jgi:hypothetical protein
LPLSSCWLDDFKKAIEKTAARDDLEPSFGRDFLYFMLGIMSMNFQYSVYDMHRPYKRDSA